MNISIIGLGYVGTVCSACFAKEGHGVIGVDIDKTKIALINQKKSPIVEKDLGEFIKNGVESGHLMATNDLKYAIENSDLTIICVGTPSQPNGNIDLTYIKEAAKAIGRLLKNKNTFHVVSMRSTVLPGTGKNVVIPIIEEYSEKKLNRDFGYVSNPEFLRESTAIWDFYNPPKTVVGVSDKKSANIFKNLYSFLDASYIETETEIGEMIKYADNSWHATKVTFANEIGLICKKLNIDSHKIMDIFCKDRKLNISPYYLKPGFAFGGSCLPKDVKAITYKAKSLDENTPLLNSLMLSNRYQIERVFEQFIKPTKKRKIGLLGISFKANTDDLRESPILELVELLIGKGFEVKIFDQAVTEAYEKGANKSFMDNELNHIKIRLEKDMETIISQSEILIIGNASAVFKDIPNRLQEKVIIDLVRIDKKLQSKNNYIGIDW